MQIVDFSKVHRGAIIKFSIEDQFEGWAKLVSPQNRSLTFSPEGKELFAMQRWFIRWLPVDGLTLTKEERFSQINLAGKSCHRLIGFKIGSTKQIIQPEKKEEFSEPTNTLTDDYNGLF